MEFEKTSLSLRRRFNRYLCRETVIFRKKGVLSSKKTYAMVGISFEGFELETSKSYPLGTKANVELPGDAGHVRAVCRWSKPVSKGQYLSGWVTRGLAQSLLIQKAIEANSWVLQDDRRNLASQGHSSVRNQDSFGTNAVLEPDTYPLYRRDPSRDRRRERPGSAVSESTPGGRNRRRGDRRKLGAHYPYQDESLMKSVRSIVSTARDALIPHLPNPVVRLLVGQGEFVFIAHPRDQRDVVRMYPFTKWLPESWIKKWFMRQKPFIAAPITGLKNQNGKPVKGWFLIAPRWTVQMMKNNQMGREVIADTAKLAEKIGAKIAGLGAFTSIVTHDGQDLLDKVGIGLTTGNPLSAAVAIQNVVKAASLVGLDLSRATVAIVGAGGSVGSGCSRLLAHRAGVLLLIDINKKSLAALSEGLVGKPAVIQTDTTLAQVIHADVVVVVTNSPGVVIHAEHLKPGAIVVDCAQPKNVSDEVPKKRDDVLVIESAILETPGVQVHFDMDLNPTEALGCLAETMVLTYMGWPSSYALGKAPEHQVREVYDAARKAGFKLAYFRNSEGYINEKNIATVKDIVQKRKS